MIEFPLPATIDTLLLEEQLDNAGLPSGVYVYGDTLVLGNLEESDRAAAQAVIDAHAPAAQAAFETAATERTNETTIRDRAEQALAANQTFRESGIPATAAARLTRLEQEAERANRQRSGLIRLLLNRFDGTD